jgi:hypothetical protein
LSGSREEAADIKGEEWLESPPHSAENAAEILADNKLMCWLDRRSYGGGSRQSNGDNRRRILTSMDIRACRMKISKFHE